MAARNPTSWTQYLDEEAFVGGKKILKTVPDNVYDDLEFCLDAPMMIVSDIFQGDSQVTSGTFGADRVFPAIHKDMCGVSATSDVQWAALVKADTGDTGEVRLVGSSSSDTISFTNTAWAWTSLATYSGQTSDGSVIDWTLTIRRSAGSGAGVQVAGIIILAVET